MNQLITILVVACLFSELVLTGVTLAQSKDGPEVKRLEMVDTSQSTSARASVQPVAMKPGAIRRSTLIPTDKSIAMFEARVRKNVKDYPSRSVLGRLYLRRAKENDDFHDYILAENSFRQVLELQPNNLGSRAFLAEALIAQHRFKEAKTAALKVVSKKPNATVSIATLGDACLQLGDYSQAESSYQKLLKLSQSPAAIVRMASLLQLRGNTEEALKLVERAASMQQSVAGEPSTEAWHLWRYADMLFSAGKIDEAKQKFNETLMVDPGYPQALAGLALIEAFIGDKESAISLYRRAVESSDEPPLLVALGDLLESIGQNNEADDCFQRAEELMNDEATDPAAGPAHARERAIYLADHDKRLELALALAKGDLSVRNDVYTQDVLAWAFYKNKQYELAAAASAKALAQGTCDAKFHYHAGMIAIALGHHSKGKHLLEKAIALNPCFSIRDVAQIKEMIEIQ